MAWAWACMAWACTAEAASHWPSFTGAASRPPPRATSDDPPLGLSGPASLVVRPVLTYRMILGFFCVFYVFVFLF